MNIYLIGMPGSGKSTIAMYLEKKLNFQRIDMDDEIEAVTNSTIQDIFNSKGEAEFRNIERFVLSSLSQKSNLIVSTGGGAACFFDNISVMNSTGITVYLDVPVKTLLQRLISQKDQVRPMVKDKSVDELEIFLNNKLSERVPFYKQAKIELSGDNIQAESLMSELNKLPDFIS